MHTAKRRPILCLAVTLLVFASGCSEKRASEKPGEVLGSAEADFVATVSEPAGFALTALPTSGLVVAGKSGVVCYSFDGEEQWRFQAPEGDEIVARPAVAPDSSVFILTRQTLVAVAASGERSWTVPVEPADLPAVIALGDGAAVVTSGTRTLVSYDFAGGEQWRFELPDNDVITSLPATANNSQIFVQGSSRIYAVDPSGVPLWDEPL